MATAEVADIASPQILRGALTRDHREVLTLDPSKFVELNQQPLFLDTHGRISPHIRLPSGTVTTLCMRTEVSPLYGFLYFYQAPTRPALSAEIRFRVTPDSNPSSFNEGYDLMLPNVYQTPWRIRLLSMASAKHTRPFLSELVNEGLIAPSVMTDIERLANSRIPASKSEVLFDFDDAFRLPLTQLGGQTTLSFYTNKEQFTGQIRVFPGLPSVFQSGLIRAKFERSTLPIHASRRVALVRCLEILQPVVLNPDVSEQYRPQPGKLLMLQHKAMTAFMPIEKDVDRQQMMKGLSLLW